MKKPDEEKKKKKERKCLINFMEKYISLLKTH